MLFAIYFSTELMTVPHSERVTGNLQTAIDSYTTMILRGYWSDYSGARMQVLKLFEIGCFDLTEQTLFIFSDTHAGPWLEPNAGISRE